MSLEPRAATCELSDFAAAVYDVADGLIASMPQVDRWGVTIERDEVVLCVRYRFRSDGPLQEGRATWTRATIQNDGVSAAIKAVRLIAAAFSDQQEAFA